MRILVAEDDKDMNRLITKRLKMENYSVDSCYNGKEVFEYLACAEYDGREGGSVWVSLGMWGGDIQGEVKDDGIGIEEKDLPHIWERFYQADKERSESGSSGLGLSMVKWIVKVHGGEIWVKSKVGEGSCFYFSFPMKEL